MLYSYEKLFFFLVLWVRPLKSILCLKKIEYIENQDYDGTGKYPRLKTQLTLEAYLSARDICIRLIKLIVIKASSIQIWYMDYTKNTCQYYTILLKFYRIIANIPVNLKYL